MQDLSSLAKDSMWVTSQEGGNMVHDNSPAMTAPGSEPVTPVPKMETQPDPTVGVSDHLGVGTQHSRRPATSYAPSPAQWKVIDHG